MFGGDKGKTRRVHNLQSDVAALEAALEAAQAEYDKVMDRNLKVGSCRAPTLLGCWQDPVVAVCRLDAALVLHIVSSPFFPGCVDHMSYAGTPML